MSNSELTPSLVQALSNADPAVLVTIVCIVALVIVGGCVKHLSAAIKRNKD